MPITYSDTLKTNRLQIMSDRVAGKTAVAATGTATAGQLVIGTAALSGATGVLAILPLSTTPFVISGSGTVIATLQGAPSVTATGAGTAAKAELRQNNGTTVEVSGLTVGTSGADINLTSTNISVGQTVTVTSGVITHG